jgi:hypothetical protein
MNFGYLSVFVISETLRASQLLIVLIFLPTLVQVLS